MYKHLNPQQRYTISVMKQKGFGTPDIAEAIGVTPCTVWRELKRNSGKRGYSPALAQEMADERKERVIVNGKKSAETWERVDELLKEDLSPQQICGVLPHLSPKLTTLATSPQTSTSPSSCRLTTRRQKLAARSTHSTASTKNGRLLWMK